MKKRVDRIGEEKLMNCGLVCKIIKYNNFHDIDVEFEDGVIYKKKDYDDFKKNKIFRPDISIIKENKFIETRVGERNLMNCGMYAEIIKYESCYNIDVLFNDGEIINKRSYNEFKNGMIKNHNIKILKTNRFGEEKLNNQGVMMKIIEYNDTTDITVMFENGEISKNKTYSSFQDGGIRSYDFRIGEVFTNKYNENYTIIEYENASNVKIKFDNGYILNKTTYDSVKLKRCANPYTKTVHNIGYIGEGEYSPMYINGDGKYRNTNQYAIWNGMLNRCYNPKYHEKKPTYIRCTVCEEWLNFQVFSKWYDENYYQIENEVMQIDKDIICKGNKIYSPNTCCFVTIKINSMFTKCDKARGQEYIGVTKKNNKFEMKLSMSINNDRKRIIECGFNTSLEAHLAYKQAKEEYIQQIANEYKSKYIQFPERLYNAMMLYQVEITD